MDTKQILDKIELRNSDGRFLLSLNENFFEIGSLLYLIIEYKKQDFTWTEIQTTINKNLTINIEKDDLVSMVNEKLQDIYEKSTKEKKSYIYWKWVFLSENRICFLTNFLQILFRKKVITFLSLISCILSVYYFSFQDKLVTFADLSQINVSKLGYSFFLIYLCSVSIMIFHEIGHAAAARFFNIKSAHIGFGFYLIFPVFFTDVSKVWVLNRKERITVNLAGVYFQLLINSILILIILFSGAKDKTLIYSIEILILSNSFIILNCLNPFLRNDGYWIYSDYYCLSNLMEKVMIGPVNFVRKYFNRQYFKKNHLPVTIYGILNYFVITIIGVIIFKTISRSINGLMPYMHQGFFSQSFFETQSLLDVVKLCFSLFICSMYLYKVVNYVIKSTKRAKLI